MAKAAIATLLRRSLRQARYQGLRPTIDASCSSSARSCAVSSVKSVAGSVAISLRGERIGGARAGAPPVPTRLRRFLLHADPAEVELVEQVVDVAACVDLRAEEVGELPVHVRHPRGLLHHHAI